MAVISAVAQFYLFIPYLKRFAPDAVQNGEESALKRVFEHNFNLELLVLIKKIHMQVLCLHPQPASLRTELVRPATQNRGQSFPDERDEKIA